MSDAAIDVFPVSASSVPAIEPAPSRTHAWKDGGSFGFHDLLDTLNPLQHIPLVSTIYRWITDDTPGNVARIVGDGIYGGPIGLAAGALSVAFKEETGKDPGEMMVALVTAGPGNEAKTHVAAADDASPAPAPAAGSPAPAPAAPPAPTAAASPAPTQSAAAANPSSVDAHPPIPLFKAAAVAAPARAAAGTPSAAEQAFLAQNAFFQRAAQRQSVAGRPFTAPVPLQLTGQVVPGTGRPQLAGPALAPPVSPAAPAAGPAQSGPIDVPQRMLDALDKYMQLQQQKPRRGDAIDLAP